MKNVAILVGHHGPGTGCEWLGRDEWTLAKADASMLLIKLTRAGFDPHVCAIDNRDPVWRSVAALTAVAGVGGLKNTNHAIRANWARALGADIAIELHYNADQAHKGRGFEVLAFEDQQMGTDVHPEAHRLATCMVDAFSAAWPDRPNRGMKPGQWKVLGQLRPHVPASLILEPAFIHEPTIGTHEWRVSYTEAIAKAVVAYAAT